MNKVTLKIGEILELEAELSGVVDQQSGKVVSEGILSKELNLVTKYWLGELAKSLSGERESLNKLREDLIKKYGKEDKETGEISIPIYINPVKNEEGNVISADFNPDYLTFQQEYEKLLLEEKEIEYKPLKLENFEGIKTATFPKILFRLIEKPEVE